MAIPIIATPIYELILPSTGKKIKYRPFLVKEEKMLLLAMETKDSAQIQTASKTVIADCTFGEMDVEKCPPFDLEYIMLQLRIKSVGEKVTPNFKCKKCETANEVEVDLTNINVIQTPEHTNTIKLSDTMGVVMRYPTMSDDDIAPTSKEDSENVLKNAERSMQLIASCIDAIYDGEKVYNTKNFTKQEVMEFIENLSQGMFQKIATFFQNMPSLKHDIKFACAKCGEENNLSIRGVQDFFT
jgi:ribosomal protein L44E